MFSRTNPKFRHVVGLVHSLHNIHVVEFYNDISGTTQKQNLFRKQPKIPSSIHDAQHIIVPPMTKRTTKVEAMQQGNIRMLFLCDYLNVA
jgi:hypothetical protein